MPEPEEIQHEIEVEREHLAQHLSELKERVDEATDLRTYISPLQQKRLQYAAIAFGACLVLAFIFWRK